jgi:molybdate/tungstate transport system substrate-binding protein
LTKSASHSNSYLSTVTYIFAVFLLLLIPFSIAALGACSGIQEKKTEMRVLCAGSLIMPFTDIEKAFEAKYPDIDVLVEGHGSIQVIRHVTELYEEADVVAVADHSLIPMMMYNVKIPETDESYADWYISFATNSLGLAYTPASRYAGEINEGNWYEILAKPDIKFGLSDPRLDACGYRTLMVLSLAESFYRDDAIFNEVLGAFNPPVEVSKDNKLTTVIVPEILHPESERIVLRGSSIRMLALLESGDIDYAFEYLSVAKQHRLNFLSLPSEINLGSVEQSEQYGRVKCKLDFHRFSSVQPEFTGQPIVYGITIPHNAPHPEEAVIFLQFLCGPEGKDIFNLNYQPLLEPARADNETGIPQELRTILD